MASRLSPVDRLKSLIGSKRDLVRWLEVELDATDKIAFASTKSPPSRNLKNRLGQPRARGSLLVFAVAHEHHDDAVKALRQRWKANGWSTLPEAVLVVAHDERVTELGPIITSRRSVLAERFRERVVPEVEVVLADGFDEATKTWANLHELANALNVPLAWLQEVHDLMVTDKAVVFYGPPGTGKTYIARQLAKFVQPDATLRTTVQFHPSYTYEQFFEGYQPTPAAQGFTLDKRPGPLRRLVDSIGGAESTEPGVMILDEMNRGNLPKVFGELYYLLEYRDDAVELMYARSSDEAFRLPPNLMLIGTMNTADRAIALVDQALRRRFRFVGLFPHESPLAPSDGHQGVLREFLQKKNSPLLQWLPQVLDLANERLGDPNVAIGPSHFLSRSPIALTEAAVAKLWRYTVLPSIEDALIGSGYVRSDFELSHLREAVDEAGS